ncbi:hypothetical protein DICPUDRAFT_158567 [Dictyostelium purpureum]|uniref:Uncharacterized protein n=1 Tax=Dictyostelium purpureum TaxID=5786 RepID=F1A1X4_DICPU|nr:uncharacterized protein DICPUDRAFT_158567 [Dictyostelium purpureum]EGC29801.1 hypothetical protein DICPUDRAFT_158567 [Dictyostelium purpureum]|eukprot:XP_003293666.1 hypothetical protein DICPUDRAFT_158567 [Dictyostelium purpureum]
MMELYISYRKTKVQDSEIKFSGAYYIPNATPNKLVLEPLKPIPSPPQHPFQQLKPLQPQQSQQSPFRFGETTSSRYIFNNDIRNRDYTIPLPPSKQYPVQSPKPLQPQQPQQSPFRFGEATPSKYIFNNDIRNRNSAGPYSGSNIVTNNKSNIVNSSDKLIVFLLTAQTHPSQFFSFLPFF